jgi:predicted enzyme related to lactoylglutathione lyase
MTIEIPKEARQEAIASMQQPAAAAVIYAKDLARVSRFYAGVAGLRTLQQEAGFAVMETAGFQLTVVAIPPRIAEQIEITAPPARREDTALKLAFFVPGIAAARACAADLGGIVDGPEREWTMHGWRHCDGHDPEGNVFQLREPMR